MSLTIQEIYQILRQTSWDPNLQSRIAQFEQKTRLKVLGLVSKAYSSIRVEKAAALLGISREEVFQGRQSYFTEMCVCLAM